MEKKDFQIIDVFPSLDEISKPQKPFIRPNIINGAYQSVEDYLDIQFRLMREDFISPLREAVTEFLKNCTKYQFDNIKYKFWNIFLCLKSN